MQTQWRNRLVKTDTIGPRICCETTPFVWNGRLCRLENHPRYLDFPGKPPQYLFHEDEVRIRDVATNVILSTPLKNHYFASGFIHEGRLHVFAGDYGDNRPWWHIHQIVTTSSTDLVHWEPTRVVIQAENDERLFNTAACFDGREFFLLYESNDKRWKPFTFKFKRSRDLLTWSPFPEALYGTDKYVGGPSLYHEAGFFYVLYVDARRDGSGYDTRIARSNNLIHWEDAPSDRPVLTFDPAHHSDPECHPDVCECSASDAEICEWQGRTLVTFNGGDQQGVNDLQTACFNGSPREFLAHYFAP